MAKKRRRGIYSDWILALRDSRKARRLLSRSKDVRIARNEQHEEMLPDQPRRSTNSPLIHSQIQSECVPNIRLERNEDGSMERSTDTISREDDYFQPFNEEYPQLRGESDHECDMESEPESVVANESNSNHDAAGGVVSNSQSSTSQDEVVSGRSRIQDFVPGTDVISSTEPDLVFLRKTRQKWEGSLLLTAMISVVGSLRYSVQDYEYCRDIVLEHVPGASHGWPSYSRVHKYFQEVIQHCFPENKLVDLPQKTTRSVPTIFDSSSPVVDVSGPATEKVRIFLPSAWAKLDIATSVVYDTMYPDGQGGSTNWLDQSDAVQNREIFTSACDHVMLSFRGDNVACGPGSLIEIHLQEGTFNFDTLYDFSRNDDSCSFSCLTVATWCVGAEERPNPSYHRAAKTPELTSNQKVILRTLSTSERLEEPDTWNESLYRVLPGDICTLLSSEKTGDSNVFDAVLVNRFWRFEDGTPSTFLIWVRVCKGMKGTPFSLDVAENSLVLDICLRRPNMNRGLGSSRKFQSQGILSNGTPFVVYRVLLYCDDFQNSSGPYSKGSAGGCYFLPMSLPPEARRSTSAVRIVSLTPPGISTNEVLRYITDDLVSATVYGIDGTNPKGEKVKIFIDVMGFIGDYPAATATVDVMGHVSRAPCNLCSFRRLHADEADGSRYGYTTNVHAKNSTFLRHSERHLSLRRSNIPNEDAAFLGMISSSRAEKRCCPLIHFAQKLESMRSNIPLTSSGSPVLSGLFDPYRSNVIAPDHLLTGLSKDVLNTLFQSLPSDDMRLKMDIFICAALRDNGLLKQGEVLNVKKKTLHSMTLSEIYCVMLVAEPIAKLFTASFGSEHVSRQASSLLSCLQSLIALTFWWPQRTVDGQDAVLYIETWGGQYHSDLKLRSKSYVKQVHVFCKTFPEHKSHLDKPNLHRLIELYEQSIPMFGHAREFMELVFEGAHQPLKRCIANSNNHSSHIFATEHCVGNDWQGRIAALSRDLESVSDDKRLSAKRGLRRIMLGEKAEDLDESTNKNFVNESDEIIQKQFSRAIHRRFQKDNRISNFTTSKHSKWVARGVITSRHLSKILGISHETSEGVIATATSWINALFPPIQSFSEQGGEHELKLFSSSRRVRLNTHGRTVGKPNGTDTISANSVVCGLFEEHRLSNRILQTCHEPEAQKAFFAIMAVLQRKQDMVWALCLKCDTIDTGVLHLKSALHQNSFQILGLSADVRRVAVYHMCKELGAENGCTFHFQTKTLKHSRTLLGGARMIFQTRQDGYPPRQA